MTSGTEPFALIDDFDRPGRAVLHTGLIEAVETRDPEKVAACLERLNGSDGAGFIAYEAGLALEARLAPLGEPPAPDAPPLVWIGRFARSQHVDPDQTLPSAAGAWAGRPRPRIAEAAYRERIAQLLEHIAAGDIYQANFTFQADVATAGHPAALYAGLRQRARAGHGALIFTGSHWLLSLSPEIFFAREGDRVRTRPMKGTAPPGSDPDALRDDPKQRAENLMIVDLIRNDLSRVARPGTVRVPHLFEIETYPTVLQMTSTVTAELEPGTSPARLLGALFPCGSITGAPKIRAMEIIAMLEAERRGPYCGAIGSLDASGDARFNVAIRTLVLKAGESRARIGLGSGIVADSRPGDEWRECLVKGAFVEDPRRFDLIETMAFDPHHGLSELDRHLARLKRSADALDFACDRHVARNELQAATFRAGPSVVRLLLSRSGALAIEVRPLPAPAAEPVRVSVVDLPVASDDFRLAHKTSDRGFYDAARAAAGSFEVLFRDPAGFLTEGSFTSLFVERGGRLVTPPLSRGLLPGVLRERLIDEGKAVEGDLIEADLGQGFLIGNSVRGLIRAVPA